MRSPPPDLLENYMHHQTQHGCFWHRCPVCNPSTPKNNVEYWEAKFARNVERDKQTREALEAAGWRVVVIWESN